MFEKQMSFVLLIIHIHKNFSYKHRKRKKKRINITISLQGTPKTKKLSKKRMNKTQKTGVGNLQKKEINEFARSHFGVDGNVDDTAFLFVECFVK
jgi:hypothetical protein